MSTGSCPSESRLIAFLLGEMSLVESDNLIEHLEVCPLCETAADRLEQLTNSVVAAVRRGGIAQDKKVLRRGQTATRRPEVSLGSDRSRSSWGAAHPEIPGYEMIRKLGQGGMGTVFEARHLQLGRRVALKVVSIAADAAHDRFLTEAESIAALRHPNIVQLFEVGEHEGLPFVTLELVEGGSLDQVLAKGPQSPCNAALFARSLALALAHAHAQGIIHRDLKPANVLLAPPLEKGGPLIPKVTDFGIAKRIGDDDGLTRDGDLLGTPAYMSPEQASGELGRIGPASDIYGLGVILYEMLTGRVPFRGIDVVDTLLLVRTQEPVPPRRLNPSLPRDIETICLKCLEKDPQRRYTSADDLASDLARWLEGRPIFARPVGSAERLRLWAGRRPAIAGLLATIMLVTGVGFSAVVVQWRRAETHLADARRRFDIALEAIEDYYTGVSEEVLLEQPGLDNLRSRLLNSPLAFFRQLQDELRDSQSGRPADLLRIAEAMGKLAEITARIGTSEDAIEVNRRVVSIAQELITKDPREPAYRRVMAQSFQRLGELHYGAGDFERARQKLNAGLREFERLAYRRKVHLGDLNGQAACHSTLGALEQDSGRHESAALHLSQSVSLRERIVREDPANLDFADDLASTFSDQAILYFVMGRLDDSEKRFLDCLKARKRLVRLRPNSAVLRRDLSSSYNNLGSFYQNTNRLGDALPFSERALEIQEKLVAEQPAVTLYRRDLAISLFNIGIAYFNMGQRERSKDYFRRAAEHSGELCRDDPSSTQYAFDRCESLLELAVLHRLDREFDQAAACLGEAVETADRLLDSAPELTELLMMRAHSWAGLGDVDQLLGRSAASEMHYEAAFRDLDRFQSVDEAAFDATYWRSFYLEHFAELMRRVGRLDEAESILRHALTLVDDLLRDQPGLSKHHTLLADLSITLGKVSLRRGLEDPDGSHLLLRASELFQRASAEAEGVLRAEPDEGQAAQVLARSIRNRARILSTRGLHDEALDLLERLDEKGPADTFAKTRLLQAKILAQAGQPEEANLLAKEVCPSPSSDDPDQLFALASVYTAGVPIGDESLRKAEELLELLRVSPARGDGLSFLQSLGHPDYDPLRGRIRFELLLMDLAFPKEPFTAGGKNPDPSL